MGVQQSGCVDATLLLSHVRHFPQSEHVPVILVIFQFTNEGVRHPKDEGSTFHLSALGASASAQLRPFITNTPRHHKCALSSPSIPLRPYITNAPRQHRCAFPDNSIAVNPLNASLHHHHNNNHNHHHRLPTFIWSTSQPLQQQ